MTVAERIHPREIIAAFDWWRDAGVDCDFGDDVTDWLAEPPVQVAAEAPARKAAAPAISEPVPSPKIDLIGANPPGDLAAFREFWLAEPALDAVGPRGRVPPRGETGARLMVLVMDPEAGDSDMLLSQAQGRLLSRMLAAMEVSESEVYFASVLPRHMPMADGATLAAQGFREVLQRHIALAAPRGILAFGSNILPLLGHNAAQDPAALEFFNHEGSSVPLLASEGLDSLMAMPRLKARFWRRWLEWTGKQA